MCHMRALTTTNLDYLTARLHGRRSRMAEGDRLDALCRLRSVSELARHVWPDSDVQTVAEFQRRLVEELVREMSEFLPLLDESGARLIEWMLVRLQREGADAAACRGRSLRPACLPGRSARACRMRASVPPGRSTWKPPWTAGITRNCWPVAAALPSEDTGGGRTAGASRRPRRFNVSCWRGARSNYGLAPEDVGAVRRHRAGAGQRDAG